MEEILNSLPAPMQLNISLFVVAAIFLVLILLLNQLIFKPLVGVLDERQKQIEEGKRAREQSLQTVEEKMAAYRTAVIEARKEAQAIRQNLLKESEKVREEIVSSAKQKAADLVQEGTARIGAQVNEAETTLKHETQAIATSIVTSVLSRASA